MLRRRGEGKRAFYFTSSAGRGKFGEGGDFIYFVLWVKVIIIMGGGGVGGVAMRKLYKGGYTFQYYPITHFLT